MSQRTLRPVSVERLVQDLVDRLRRLERRSRYTVGSGTTAYVLEVPMTGANAGKLTARHATTGTVTVIANP